LHVYGQAFPHYTPQRYFGRVTLFQGEKRCDYSSYDWRQLIAEELEIHELPGEHMDMIKEPQVTRWAKRLQQCLDREP
jgi:thioesterase domain-containing protein